MDAVRVCLLLVVELVFMGKEDRNCITRHLLSLVEDFDCWNDYPWGEYMWVKFYKKTVNVAAKHMAFHLDKKKQNSDYYPIYNLYGFPLAFKIWILESYPNSKKCIEYINGLVDLDMNVSEDDIGGDVSNNSFNLNDNDVSGNGNNYMILLERGDGFVDSVGGDKNHECNQDKQDQQDKQPSLTDVLHELRALRKEVALVKVDDARIAKLERILNDNFIPCNDRSKESSCFSPATPNDEIVVSGTAIHSAYEMYDSPKCVTDNDVKERIGVSSNYSMSNTSCPEMHNAEVLVAGMGIDKADENIYNPNANDNDVNQGIAVSFNARMSNSSGHDMPNAMVVVACLGIDKPDGHNDNPNANDNDVNQGIDPMSTCFGPDMHLAEVAVAGIEINKGDGHIDIPAASDNDPSSVSPNKLNAKVAICSMIFQNEVASNVEYEGNVVSAKEARLDVLIQVACDGMGIDKADGYSQREPSTLNAIIEGFDSHNNNQGIDFLQHDDNIDCFVAKPNDHPIVDIGVKPVQENKFADDVMDVFNGEESLHKVSLDDMNVDEQEEKLIDIVKLVFLPISKKRKKSHMKTNYVLRYVKERRKRLAMTLESPFSQQPPTTPVQPKRGNMIDCYSNSIRYPVVWRDVEKVYFLVNEPKRHWCLAELHITTGVVTFNDSLGWVCSNKRLLWRNMKKTLAQQLTLYLNEHGVLQSKGIAVERYEITYKFSTVIEQADHYGDCGIWVCIFLYILSRNLPLPVHEPLQTSLAYRERILQYFWTHKIEEEKSLIFEQAIMTMPTHHFTNLLGFNNQDEPIVEAATADVIGHRVQVYMENSQSFKYVDIQRNANVYANVWTGGLMCYVDLAKIKSFLCYMGLLIIIYAAHLKGTCIGTNLVAVGMDANNQIIPIATGVSQGKIDTPDDELTPRASAKIKYRYLKSSNWSVRGIVKNELYQVRDNQVIHTVYLKKGECTCCRWKLLGLPFGYVCAVARVEGLTSVNNLAKPWFLNKTIKGTYAGLFFPVTDISTWEIPNEIQQVLPPDMGKKQSGRPKNIDRIHSQREGPIINKCGWCGVKGHN
nr:ulp1 protease family, C-terminal catalytic domain-containing protein [Tanacetum cinerariifolium]